MNFARNLVQSLFNQGAQEECTGKKLHPVFLVSSPIFVAIGIYCQDGVVFATDSMITNSFGSIGTTETKGKKSFTARDTFVSVCWGSGRINKTVIPLAVAPIPRWGFLMQ